VKASLAIALLLGILGFGVALGTIRWVISEGKDRQEEQAKTNRALCEVIAVQLSTRADRKQTIKLFESIRNENPALFDKLVKRAARGDRRIARVREDLPCETLSPLGVPDSERRPNGSNGKKSEPRSGVPNRQFARGGDRDNPPPGGGQPPPAPDDSGGGGGPVAPEPTVSVGPIEVDLPDPLPDVALPGVEVQLP
jgi:hypothetical protein